MNSTLSWQAPGRFVDANDLTWYGKRQPKNTTTKVSQRLAPETKEISPYSIVGLSTTWDVTKNVSITGGVENLFDKRLWRAGNAQPRAISQGRLYRKYRRVYLNKPGRTWYMSVNAHF
ncbi:hypothetical protein ACNKHT_03295 [Shigella flexneri]